MQLCSTFIKSHSRVLFHRSHFAWCSLCLLGSGSVGEEPLEEGEEMGQGQRGHDGSPLQLPHCSRHSAFRTTCRLYLCPHREVCPSLWGDGVAGLDLQLEQDGEKQQRGTFAWVVLLGLRLPWCSTGLSPGLCGSWQLFTSLNFLHATAHH